MAIQSHVKNIAQRTSFVLTALLANTGNLLCLVSHTLFPIFLTGLK